MKQKDLLRIFRLIFKKLAVQEFLKFYCYNLCNKNVYIRMQANGWVYVYVCVCVN